MKLLSIFLCVFIGHFSTEARAEVPLALKEVVGTKFPDLGDEGEPVSVSVRAPEAGRLNGFTELLPFSLRSPNQSEAGSCLYMSLTGIAEWWLARLHPGELRTPDGPLDLSERYLMNVAGFSEDSNGIANWKTDSIYLFQREGGALRNADFRFTKGWYAKDRQGNIRPARPGQPGASYGTSYNWIEARPRPGTFELVRLPRFRREILFADPASNQWNTGVAPFEIVDKIKAALREKKAPVHVIYNHFGFWHATVILGFDDEQDNQSCAFVRRFLGTMPKKAEGYRSEAERTKDPSERARLLRVAEKTERAYRGAKGAWDSGGGCHPKGVFFVRDSIYGDPNGPVYDYDRSRKGEEAPYGKSTVLLEYDWIRTLANHVVQIRAD